MFFAIWLFAPKILKWSKMLPKMVPSWPSQAPSRPKQRHLGAILAHLGAKMGSQSRSNRAPEAVQIASKAAQRVPERLQDLPQGGIFMNCVPFWGWCCSVLGSILNPFLCSMFVNSHSFGNLFRNSFSLIFVVFAIDLEC